MRFTIFTPTYNRGYIIENLYRSLQKQTYKDFEWIVVDDGSKDNTEILFNKWTKENIFFEIKYIKVNNGGKHRAINIGTELAKSELFFIVDSDDYLTEESLEIIDKVEKSIDKNIKQELCGVCGLRGNNKKSMIGTTFSNCEYLDIFSFDREKNGISGDKAEVFYTSVIKKYKFPEYEGENFITERVVWDKMAYDKYKLRYFNKIVYM